MSEYIAHKSDLNVIEPAVEEAVKSLGQFEEVGDVVNATNSVVLTLLNYEMDKINVLIQAREKLLLEAAYEIFIKLFSGALTLVGEMAKRLNIPVEDLSDLLKKQESEPHFIYGGTIDVMRDNAGEN